MIPRFILRGVLFTNQFAACGGRTFQQLPNFQRSQTGTFGGCNIHNMSFDVETQAEEEHQRSEEFLIWGSWTRKQSISQWARAHMKLTASIFQLLNCDTTQLRGFSTKTVVNDKKIHAEQPLLSEKFKTIAAILQCTTKEMGQLSQKYTFFEHMAEGIIKEKVGIMQSFGLPVSFVKDNPRLLYQISASILTHRLRLLQEENLLKHHALDSKHLPHYLECNSDVFETVFQNLCAERNAYEGCQSQEEYLCYRLKCSEQQSAKLMSTYPLRRKVSQRKLKNFLDFMLIEAGRDAKFVMKNIVLCNTSVLRLRHRYKVMQMAGVIAENQMAYIWKLPSQKFDKEFGAFSP